MSWSFSQRFPDHIELREYMEHVDKTLNLRKDVTFDARVNSSTWDAALARWTITAENGIKAQAQFIILATGLLHKAHTPKWPSREKYKGDLHHSGEWRDDINVKGKKVAVIGSGATSVQIVQELAKEASQLTVLLRRPSYCLPMRQRTWTEQEQLTWKAYYPALFDAARNSAAGFPIKPRDARSQDVSPEERDRYFEEIWASGGINFLLGNYKNLSVDKEASKIAYDFWKKKVRERLTDPKKQELMCPNEMPYFFSTKRIVLEGDYYEILNKDNVKLVDIKEHPIEAFAEQGLQLGGEEGVRNFDVIICATGFDSFTGSLVNMGLKSKEGIDLKDVWDDGVKTYLGMMIHGFPNAFMVCSPQAPTALSNGPTVIGS
jgi:cation diffusion facilitator CzcD-associated flavoprotein CzcO